MEEGVDIEAGTQQQQREDRIARSVLDIDHFASTLAREFARSKSTIVRELARDLDHQAQAVRLAFAMELHGERLSEPCDELAWTAARLQLRAWKMPGGTMVTSARSIASLTLSFGLVNVPVRLFSATESGSELASTCSTRTARA